MSEFYLIGVPEVSETIYLRATDTPMSRGYIRTAFTPDWREVKVSVRGSCFGKIGNAWWEARVISVTDPLTTQELIDRGVRP